MIVTAINWYTPTASCKNNVAKTRPNIDDVEKMSIVLTVPTLLRLCKKK